MRVATRWISGAMFTLSLFGQQVPDPSFPTAVASPAYRENGPLVLFDEGHHNLHGMQAGYGAFASLMKNDGYRLETTSAAFTPASLARHRILVIVNARGAGNDAPMPTECYRRRSGRRARST